MGTRFGEAALAHCEVMLQDIKDSKRTNVNVQQLAKARRQQVAPFAPPTRGARGDGAGQLSRPFMAPFSLSNIFGLCLSPQGGAATGDSLSPAPTSAVTNFQPGLAAAT